MTMPCTAEAHSGNKRLVVPHGRTLFSVQALDLQWIERRTFKVSLATILPLAAAWITTSNIWRLSFSRMVAHIAAPTLCALSLPQKTLLW